jgi:hypothetical protein
MRYFYITVLDPGFYPRPYFFFKCCGIPTYFLRTFTGYLRNPQKISGGREAIIRRFGDQERPVEVDTQLSGGDLQLP